MNTTKKRTKEINSIIPTKLLKLAGIRTRPGQKFDLRDLNKAVREMTIKELHEEDETATVEVLAIDGNTYTFRTPVAQLNPVRRTKRRRK